MKSKCDAESCGGVRILKLEEGRERSLPSASIQVMQAVIDWDQEMLEVHQEGNSISGIDVCEMYANCDVWWWWI